MRELKQKEGEEERERERKILVVRVGNGRNDETSVFPGFSRGGVKTLSSTNQETSRLRGAATIRPELS